MLVKPLHRPCHNFNIILPIALFLPVGTEINFIPEAWHLIHCITRFNPELDCTLTLGCAIQLTCNKCVWGEGTWRSARYHRNPIITAATQPINIQHRSGATQEYRRVGSLPLAILLPFIYRFPLSALCRSGFVVFSPVHRLSFFMQFNRYTLA